MADPNTPPPNTEPSPIHTFIRDIFLGFTDADIALIIAAVLVGPFFWHYYLESIGPLYPPLVPRRESEAGDPQAGGPGNIDWEFGADIPHDPVIPVALSHDCSDDDYCPYCGRSIIDSTDYDSCSTEYSDTSYRYGTDTGTICGTRGESECYSD